MWRVALLALVAACSQKSGPLGPADKRDAAASRADDGAGLVDGASSIDALGEDAALVEDAAREDVVRSDVGGRDAGSADGWTFDSGRPAECTTAADCTMQPFGGVVACRSSSSWSCVAGVCVWECSGGRTCRVVPPSGPGHLCISCDGAQPQCQGDPCRHGLSAAMREDANCARDFFHPLPECFGDFAVLSPDGNMCTLEELPTGARRSVLACGPCQTQFMW